MSIRPSSLWVTPTLVLPVLLAAPGPAFAHATQQGFVLLLPTDAYIAAGVATVVLTVLALAALPGLRLDRVFAARPLALPRSEGLRTATSLSSLALILFMLWIGLFGPPDPLSNLMSMAFWTLGWMGLVSLCGVSGNLWLWVNPWSGLLRLVGPDAPRLAMPAWLGAWPAVILLVAFTAYLLAGIAPDDPAQLARLVAAYGLATFVGLWLFGPAWMRQVELGQAIMGAYGALCMVRAGPRSGWGGPGWQLAEEAPGRATGVFALTLLAAGSFDGLNETFWWFGLIGVNPLEFPGRSAVIVPTLLGLIGAILGLALVFALAIWAGLRLTRATVRFGLAFEWLALALLPIALAYHVAHYLPSFLVAVQYSVAAINDPFAAGASWLGIGHLHVTTGFFNRLESVRVIWLCQAGLVVLGHVWSVLLAHAIGLRLVGEGRETIRLTVPISVLMIGYTMLGLWLLAAPRGV